MSGQQRTPSAKQDPSPGSAGSDGTDALGGRDPGSVRAFIERFTGQLTQAGFPRTPARIFVALLTSDSSRLANRSMLSCRSFS